MGHRFAEIAFTDTVRKVQLEQNSRAAYSKMDQGEDFNFLLSQQEMDFISQRDSFYMASVSDTQWPYVQHRGGPAGFIKIIDQQTIGFADFSGNRQYVSTGNFRKNNRVAIIFMDYPNRRRLKLLGRISEVADSELETLVELEVPEYRAVVERGFLIHVEAFDWNCPQHITERYTDSDIQKLLEPLQQENRMLKASSNSQLTAKATRSIGDGPLDLVVSGIRQLTSSVRSFELSAVDGSELPKYRAGAHLQIPVQLNSGEVTHRHYSISSDPAERGVYEIAVRLDEAGRGGSVAIHENLGLGQVLRCELPRNNFFLHDDARPAVLIAGGIGITPIKAMASELEARGSDFAIHLAGRSKQDMAYYPDLKRLYGDRFSAYSDAESNRLSINKLLSSIAADAVIYTCGPASLLEAVLHQARELQIDEERLRFERFVAGPDENARPVIINLINSGASIAVADNETILDAMLKAGVDIPYSCKVGVCGTCAVKVLKGSADHRDAVLNDSDKNERKLMCPCVSRAETENLDLML